MEAVLLIKFPLINASFYKLNQFVSTTGKFSCFKRNYCKMSLKTVIAFIDVILSMAYSAYSGDCIGPESIEMFLEILHILIMMHCL